MNSRTASVIWIGLGAALLLAAFVSPFASSSPDGLEKIARDQGFAAQAEAAGAAGWTHAPLKDYAVPGVKNAKLGTGAAGLAGAGGVFLLAYGGANALRRKKAGLS
jgi:hypothetical protein